DSGRRIPEEASGRWGAAAKQLPTGQALAPALDLRAGTEGGPSQAAARTIAVPTSGERSWPGRPATIPNFAAADKDSVLEEFATREKITEGLAALPTLSHQTSTAEGTEHGARRPSRVRTGTVSKGERPRGRDSGRRIAGPLDRRSRRGHLRVAAAPPRS